MVSVSKQHFGCCNHNMSGCWGKDFLILMEKPMHRLEVKHSGSCFVRLWSPEYFATCCGIGVT